MIKVRLFMALTLALISNPLWAVDCESIPKWLTRVKEVTFRVVEPTATYDVKVEFPENISKLRCEAMYFEYGTDYYFQLKRSEPVTLSYFKKGQNLPSRTSEMSEYLNAHSVMLASEREVTPHYFQVTDSELNVEYRIHLAKNGPAYVKRKWSSQILKVISWK